ncbi:hypothetical protein [Catellatospora citrea]|uniref:Uncharacterized protein n=1 Tax=Catellatospora citrea TaxID=53366 RepID=A0A8J3KJ25_9ACTN|nr:hypothetical protein [Catellatospora citrea]RKE12708.1 hypothetical protein C8E86_7651 [Catellatospora citrea]GIF96054.1 hypothetical protein Cci01nite_11480 [Catellatospora citrea]
MEPFSAIAMLAAKHGIVMVLGALGGDDKLAGVAGELFASLTATENGINQRLAGIEAQLAELDRKNYATALSNGTRYLFEANLAGDPARRAADLELARQQFIHAQSAAGESSPLRRATAGRYLLLVSIATGRTAAAAASLPDVEAALLDAALIARVKQFDPEPEAQRLVRSQGASGLFGRDAKLDAARKAVFTEGDESLRLIGQMLIEMAVLAPALGLPHRLEPIPSVRWDLQVPHDGGRIAGIGCRFQVKGWPHRVGPLKTFSYPVSAELTFEPPLRQPIILLVRMAKGPHRTQLLAAGTSRVDVPFDGYTDELTERAQRLDICPNEKVGGVLTFAPQSFQPWQPGMWQTGS